MIHEIAREGGTLHAAHETIVGTPLGSVDMGDGGWIFALLTSPVFWVGIVALAMVLAWVEGQRVQAREERTNAPARAVEDGGMHVPIVQ